jgi:DNA processing protein
MSAKPAARLTDAQRLEWLRLIRCENIGPRTFRVLIDRYGSAARALSALPALARRGGAARPIRVASRDEAEREMAAMARIGAALVAFGEPEYPGSLAAIDSAPPLLAIRGRPEVLQRPMVAIVGSRNASAAGLTMTDRLARGLAAAGLIVVSGLARGIDARAHQASLETGTVAVLPGGLDRIYPPEHGPLLERIIATGAALSEMPMGWEPRGKDFPRRNRLVAGLALGTLVVEAARRSGSLITARFANEQGREVFAVPGSPLDPRAEGTNDLLRQGATFGMGAEDIIDALQPLIAGGIPIARARPGAAVAGVASGKTDGLAGADADENESSVSDAEAALGDADGVEPDALERIAGLIGPSPIGIDDIARAMQSPIRAVQQAILELELAGRLVRHAGNLVSRRLEP